MFRPLWTDGVAVDGLGVIPNANHVVVIGGADDQTSERLVLDPAPVNIGTRTWKPYHRLGWILSQRHALGRAVTFLHYPSRYTARI